MIVSRAGTVFRQGNGVSSRKRGNTIFNGQRNDSQDDSENNKDEKLNDLVKNANTILFKASNLFPFDLFPDQLIIDLIKISAIRHEIFRATSILTVPLDEITDVNIFANPFFATLRIQTNGPHQEVIIQALKNIDAFKARRIIEGLLIARKEQVDLSELSKEDLVNKIENLGKAV